MLFTRSSEYALLSLIILAQKEEPTDTERLSTELGISKSFLAKILQALAREGILKSYKGANGGFVLNKKVEQISILQVVTIAESKPISVFECSPAREACPSNKGDFCTIWPFLNTLQRKINNFLEDLTLQDIINDLKIKATR